VIRAQEGGVVRSARTPNQALRRLLAEAGWSGAALARALNALGTELSLPLHYDRSTIGHWLAGIRPRSPVPELVAEVLSRRLGRHVHVDDTGLARALAPLPAEGSEPDPLPRGCDVLDRLDQLSRPIDRRSLNAAGVYSLAVLAIPNWSAPTGAAAPPGPPGSRRSPVTMEHVQAARSMLALLSQHDATFGAAPVRETLRQYLSTSVIPWLRADAPARVRRELFTVAGHLVYLCAFAHYDTNRNATAQHYYLTGIALAREADDPLGYALGLRGLSVQAHALGHLAHADQLAEQAARVGVHHAPGHQQAFLLGQWAVTQAALGRGPPAAHHLAAAERHLDRSTGSSPVGVYHPGSLAMQHSAVATALGDHTRAINELETSLRHRPGDECRSRAVSLADLAETHIRLGHLEQACHTWQAFLDLCPQLHSARVEDRVRRLNAHLRPHLGNRAVQTLYERAGLLGRRPTRTPR
jgi:hypothetical protein